MKAHGGTAGWPARSQAPRADRKGRPRRRWQRGRNGAPSTRTVYRRSPGVPNRARCGLPGKSILGKKKNKYQTTKTLLLPRAQAIESQQSSKSGQDESKMRRRVGAGGEVGNQSGAVARASGGGGASGLSEPGRSGSRSALTLAAA